MFVLLGFLCCLSHAAMQEREDVTSGPMYDGHVILHKQMARHEESAQLLPDICHQQAVNGVMASDAGSVEDASPPPKRRCVRQEDTPETEPTDVCSVCSDDECAGNTRQEDILAYLYDRKDCFVPEKDLQGLYKQDANEVLGDVVELIAAGNNITYKDKHYRLCCGGTSVQREVPHLTTILFSLMQDPEFNALSVAEKAYQIYEKNNVCVPVYGVALWTEMYKERHVRGITDDRFFRLVHWTHKMLQENKLFSREDCVHEDFGPMQSDDMKVIRQSMGLYAQGREALENTAQCNSRRFNQDLTFRHPGLLLHFQQHKGQPVCESTLKSLLIGLPPQSKHRELVRCIGFLRAQGHNITCMRSPEGHCRPDNRLKCLFTLEEGGWTIKEDCYKKALWKMLDKLEKQKLCVTEVFLELSGDHYKPVYGVVEEIITLKKLLSCTEKDKDFWKRRMLEIAINDGDMLGATAYYQSKIGTQENMSQKFLKKMRRLFSHYQNIHGNDHDVFFGAHDRVCASKTQAAAADVVLEIDTDAPDVGQDVVVETEVQENFQQHNILKYLCDHKDCFVPEEDLAELNGQSPDEVLEDVMALISEQHNITYKDKQYRLCSSDEPLKLEVHNVYQLLRTLLNNLKFFDLSAAEQSYYIYAERGCGYVPVPTLALWSQMQKERQRRGIAERRFKHLLCLVSRTLQNQEVVRLSDCKETKFGKVNNNDVALVKHSLNLYAQGREIVEKELRKKQSKTNYVLKSSEVLEYLRNHNEQPVSELDLRDIVKSAFVGNIHRGVCAVIGFLREQGHHITCTRSLEGGRRMNGTHRYLFALDEGKWFIKKGCYKKALWEMLDKPEMQNLSAVDMFLELSNDHYDPFYDAVEIIMYGKKLLSCEEEDEDFWKRHVLEVVIHDGKVHDVPTYYQEKVGTQKDISLHLLRRLRRFLSYYKIIHTQKAQPSELSALQL